MKKYDAGCRDQWMYQMVLILLESFHADDPMAPAKHTVANNNMILRISYDALLSRLEVLGWVLIGVGGGVD